LKIIDAQNQLPIITYKPLVCNKILKVRNLTPTPTSL
jgi:hypothetical protein